jgi:hypothetical protein
MFRKLIQLFQQLGAGQKVVAPRRKHCSFRPSVESLGERVLPTIGLGTNAVILANHNLLNSWDHMPTLLTPDIVGMAGKSVEITDPSGFDVGTVRFTTQDAFGNFQGTFESHVVRHIRLFGQEYYEANLDIGAIPISGRVSRGYDSLGGGLVSSISFSGTGTGRAREHHHYLYDDPNNPNGTMEGMPEDESWMVNDRQTISFSGAINQSGAALTLCGNVDVTDHGAWLWAEDNLAPTDPMHMQHIVPVSGPNGGLLELGVHASVSNLPIM